MNAEATVQRTHDWFAARVGKATASSFKHIMARKQDGRPAQARKDYLLQVVAERLSGQPASHYVTPAMQWGIDQEAAAREAYVDKTGNDVLEVGFIQHPTLACGASPDGIIMLDGDTGVLELKCPTTTTFVEWAMAGAMPSEHVAQVQGQMWLTQSQWAHFVAFDPRLEPNLRLLTIRVDRDDEYIARLDSEVRAFLDEVDATIEKMRNNLK